MKVRRKRNRERRRLGMKGKLILSLSSIGLVLLISSFITFFEYRSISRYVSDMIADNIHSVTLLEKIADETATYNNELGRILGTRRGGTLPDLDVERVLSYCDTLETLAETEAIRGGVATMRDSLNTYITESANINVATVAFSNEFEGEMGDWFYDDFQDKSYRAFRNSLTSLTTEIYNRLELNADRFDNGFYRSIIPGAVAVGTGLLLIILLMSFILVYYVHPIDKMLHGVGEYRKEGRKYDYEFDGDDELTRLNEYIVDICTENQQIRRRITALKEQIASGEQENEQL